MTKLAEMRKHKQKNQHPQITCLYGRLLNDSQLRSQTEGVRAWVKVGDKVYLG